MLGDALAQDALNVKVCKNESCTDAVSVNPEAALTILNSILTEGKENSVIKFCDFSQKERVCKRDYISIWNFSPLTPIPHYTAINSINFSKKDDGKYFYFIKATTLGVSVLCSRVEASFILKESRVTLESTNYCNWLLIELICQIGA